MTPTTTESNTARSRSMTCEWCDRSFNKGEHLRRHIRSHTGAKPFVCRGCKRSFNRQDSLARHEKLHTREKSSPYPSPSLTDGVTRTPADGNPPASLATVPAESASPDDQPGDLAITDFSLPSDQDYSLIWPDTEELFQSILAFDGQWQLPEGPLPFPINNQEIFRDTAATANSFSQRATSADIIPTGEGHRAVHNVSKMVSNLASSITAAVEATSINSVFLDECLHMFWVKFAPTFPVLHRATFVFRECTNPLLLNAMALGSLYLGPKDAVVKGEALWRLAHTAVATSWQSLITHRGPYDACDGVQLVVAALLAQLYGALSQNRSIRTSSQAFRSLGLFWARQCGMLDSQIYSYYSNPPSIKSSETEKQAQWRTWAAREIQLRALLGHYMLDGLLAQLSGEDTTVHHTANDLTLPSSAAVFEASSASQWLNQMHADKQVRISFRQIFRELFSSAEEDSLTASSISSFSHKVVLEGLQSLASACKDGETIGIPSRPEVERALARVYSCIDRSSLLQADKLEAVLRWHLICLDSAGDVSALCLTLCRQLGVQQNIWKSSRSGFLNLPEWVGTPDARRALAHAVAIQEIVEQLPRGRAHAIHMPSALFAAAMVYAVFTLVGIPSVRLPTSIDWQEIASAAVTATTSTSTSSMSETGLYLQGSRHIGSSSVSRNLLYELNSMQKYFKCLSSQWGVGHDMEAVIDQLITLCH